jgi:hypothetical protein
VRIWSVGSYSGSPATPAIRLRTESSHYMCQPTQSGSCGTFQGVNVCHRAGPALLRQRGNDLSAKISRPRQRLRKSTGRLWSGMTARACPASLAAADILCVVLGREDGEAAFLLSANSNWESSDRWAARRFGSPHRSAMQSRPDGLNTIVPAPNGGPASAPAAITGSGLPSTPRTVPDGPRPCVGA